MENLTGYEIAYIKHLLKKELEECKIEADTYKDEKTLGTLYLDRKNTLETILNKLDPKTREKENEVDEILDVSDLNNLVGRIYELSDDNG